VITKTGRLRHGTGREQIVYLPLAAGPIEPHHEAVPFVRFTGVPGRPDALHSTTFADMKDNMTALIRSLPPGGGSATPGTKIGLFLPTAR
jgi:hypothetical protein